jgi:hypothetical protein
MLTLIIYISVNTKWKLNLIPRFVVHTVAFSNSSFGLLQYRTQSSYSSTEESSYLSFSLIFNLHSTKNLLNILIPSI